MTQLSVKAKTKFEFPKFGFKSFFFPPIPIATSIVQVALIFSLKKFHHFLAYIYGQVQFTDDTISRVPLLTYKSESQTHLNTLQ